MKIYWKLIIDNWKFSCHARGCRFKPNSRILTTLPSTTPIWPRLRYRLTHCERILQWKPWTFGATDSHGNCALLKPTFSLPTAPPCLTTQLHRCRNAPLPHFAKGFAWQATHFRFTLTTKIVTKQKCEVWAPRSFTRSGATPGLPIKVL